jgi:hypothetical protein
MAIGQKATPVRFGFERISVKWYFFAFVGAMVSSVLAAIFADPLAALVASIILIHGTLLAFSWWVTSQGGIDLKHLVGSIPENYNWLPPAVLVIGMILYSVSSSWITNYPIAISWPEVYQELTAQPVYLTDEGTENPAAYNFLTVILLVIIAPVVEEVFFRMVLFQRLSIRWGMGTGIAVSSFLFGLVHPFDWVGAFVFGVAACVLYMRTRTIIVPIAVHALNNAIATVVAWWAIKQNWDAAFDLSAIQTELYTAIILLVLSSPIVFGLLGRWWPNTGDELPYFANGETRHR